MCKACKSSHCVQLNKCDPPPPFFSFYKLKSSFVQISE